MAGSDDLAQLSINTIRTLSIDAVQRANSGHPGAPMAMAPLAYLLYTKYLRHNPANPDFPNRDRFVLSAGHASMLLYSTLHLCGYGISLEDIKRFRQLHSPCAGHPEHGEAPGVETTTGPLGQGAANSVGMAIAGKFLAARFNQPDHTLLDGNVFALLGDGCMMEGVSAEAASLAGHLGLDNLIWFYDSNNISIEGSTDLAFSENVADRFAGYGWSVQHVADANDLNALRDAIDAAIARKGAPSLIVIKSVIGYGSPNRAGTAKAHGEALGADEVRLTKQAYGWDPEKTFHVPPEVAERMARAVERGRNIESEWNAKFEAFEKAHPKRADEWNRIQAGELPDDWDADIPVFDPDEKGLGTRVSGGKVLNAIAGRVGWLIGGSADLAPSTKTLINGSGDFAKGAWDQRNMRFGVREHAMGAIVNGMRLSKVRAYGSSFLVFSDYARPTLRLAGLMKLPVIHVYTHDSIGVGEDGPTHQPVEHLAALRAIPNLDVIRPCDANEVAEAWRYAMRLKDRPAVLALSRQNVPTLDRSKYAPADGLHRGGYVLSDPDADPDVILIGTGSEVALCLQARDVLCAQGVHARVVSMPIVEQFERQEAAYREAVLPPNVRARVSVEAGVSRGWERFVGLDGRCVARDGFGASGPAADVFAEFGFTVDNVVHVVRSVLAA